MKKYFLIVVAIVLLAAACNKQPVVQPNPTGNTITPLPGQIVQTPPANQVNWQTYRNANYSFEFQYPSGYAFETGGGHNFLEEPVVDMISDAVFLGTNFSGSSLEVSIGTDTNKCLTDIRGGDTGFTEKHTVNGVVFYKGSFTGAAAGTAYVSDIYRTIRANSLCFEIAFTYGVFNRQNLDNPDSIKEFDPKQELATYNQILSTFKFTK